MRPAFTRCLSCAQAVRPQQHALQCDGCDRWQHRLCDTGISLELYRATMRGEDGLIAWFCRDCSIPHHTSELDTTEEVNIE
ncbi:uncharacterized protein [Argopecten irradians]|uniref:uncharacterized protein n=1 Tax=Argopecten irradians TaxID=31199 RepID=UPI003723FE46